MGLRDKFHLKRSFLAGPLLCLVALLEVTHLLLVLLLPHPIIASNIVQLVLPLLAACICVYQRMFVADAVARRCWGAVASAFAIWAMAQVIYIYSLYRPVGAFSGMRPDDALWLLFGLPILLAINTTYDGWDRIQWLDRAQEIAFFTVLYVQVFLHADRSNQDVAYIIQNLALLLCSMLRVPVCTVVRERRFFVRLSIFLFVYSVLQTIGDTMYLYGWPAGTVADLVWTLPIATFIALTLRDSRLSGEQEVLPSRLIQAFQWARGLSIAALAFLSIGASAYLASRHLALGAIAMAFCFTLFAIRTNAREGAWQEAHGQLEQIVLQDPLTGLGNRLKLRSSLAERLASLSLARTDLMLFLDLDRFKSVNDSFGHSVGDRLLIEAAARLQASAPQGSVVCRLGGDEFVVLASTDAEIGAGAVAQRVLDALRQPYIFGEHVFRSTASIGVVLMTPGSTIEDLLRTADHAMYRAKQLGKNRMEVFDAPTMAHMNSRWQLESDLRATLEAGKMDVAYQPILCIGTSEISGFEALARWNHPRLGLVSPGDFIPLAEETGLILALGTQVLEKASRQVADWNRAWGKSFTVSVNVSPRQFADHGFLGSVLEILQRTGLDPALLKLEITESVLLVHETTVKQLLNEARAHGIRISLDDFGTGYSSLSFLLSLPVDEVKVDRSFVNDMHRDPERREVVGTVVHLGRTLRKRVVAEGVESEQVLDELALMGCDCAQGYLISRPLSPEILEQDMPALIARNQRTPQLSNGPLPTPASPLLSLPRTSPHQKRLWDDTTMHLPEEALEPTLHT